MNETLARHNPDDTAPDAIDYGKPVSEMQATIARLEAALKWYADRRHYMQRFDPDIDDFTSDIDEDGGLRAHKALEGKSK
jgi:hypothetical protein